MGCRVQLLRARVEHYACDVARGFGFHANNTDCTLRIEPGSFGDSPGGGSVRRVFCTGAAVVCPPRVPDGVADAAAGSRGQTVIQFELESDRRLFGEAYQFAQRQVRSLVQRDPGYYPLHTEEGKWRHDKPAWTHWCDGFLPGMMW